MLIIRDFTVKAGSEDTLAVEGNYLQLLSSNLTVGEVLTIKTENGDYVQCGNGDEIFLRPFRGLNLSHVMSVDLKIKVAISNEGERYKSNKVFGSVETINGELQRVLAGRCFIGCANINQAAGQNSHAQIYNPVGSGKRLIVNKLTLFSNLQTSFALMVSNGVTLTSLSTLTPINKVIGGVAPVAEMRAQNNVGILVLPIFGNLAYPSSLEFVEFPLAEPIVINEGYGLVVASTAQNNSCAVTYQWMEESK